MNDQPVGVGNDRTQQSLQEAINQRLVESGEVDESADFMGGLMKFFGGGDKKKE